MSSIEYIRKKNRLKKQWSYIESALKIVQLTQQAEKRKYLFDAIIKSDSLTFYRLLEDDSTLIDCPILIGYNHFNIYQIIIERSTEEFIENIFQKYFYLIERSTDYGKILVPVACERGDENILKLIVKYFPNCSLDGLSNSNQNQNYFLHDEPRQLIERELEAFENEIPLVSLIRNDRCYLMKILFQFQSFTLNFLTEKQKQQIFHLCLLAEHRQVSIDRYNIKWFKNQSLRPCGSIDCLRLLIENTNFNPLKVISNENLCFTLILEPVYLYLIQLHNKLLLDLQTKFPIRLLHALTDLIEKQMQIFSYVITHCCFQPIETDLIRLKECHHFIEEIFHQTSEYNRVKRIMFNIEYLIKQIETKPNENCFLLKAICRLKIRNLIKNQQFILVQEEKTFTNLSITHKKYLKYLL